MKFNFNFNEFYERNFGDFVHIHALREWFKGVPSLESFLKNKDDKAIVKDMHFTDERTTIDYIDTKDDTEKTETLCEYLTSDVSDETNGSIFKKVDKIKFLKNNFNETFISVREKDTKKERVNFIRSNIPVAYDATDDYQTSDKTYHIGITENGVNIYDDDTLELVREYDYTSGTSTSVNVINTLLSDCNPFSSITNQTTSETLNFQKTDFSATVVGNVVIGGQIMYIFNRPISLQAGKSIVLMLTPATMGSSIFADSVYPKVAMTPNNSDVITTIMKNSSFPLSNSIPTYITLYNSSENDVSINYLHITF